MGISPVNANRVQNFKAQGASATNSEEPNSNQPLPEKDTKKKVLIGAGIIAASAAATVGFVLLAKKGKFGDSAKDMVNKIFKPKNVCEANNTINPKATNEIAETVQNSADSAPVGTCYSSFKKLENGVGIGKFDYGDGAEQISYLKPNSPNIFKTIDVHTDDAAKTTQRLTSNYILGKDGNSAIGQQFTDTLIKKDSNGNAIEVIVKKFNSGSCTGIRSNYGGTETITKISRDGTGKVIGHTQTKSNIPKVDPPARSVATVLKEQKAAGLAKEQEHAAKLAAPLEEAAADTSIKRKYSI